MLAADSPPLKSDREIQLLGGGLIFAHRRMKAPFGDYAQRFFRQVRASRVEDLQRVRFAVLAYPAVQLYSDGLVRLRLRFRLRSPIGESAVKLPAAIVDLGVRRIFEVLRRVLGPDHYPGIDLDQFLIRHPAFDVAGEPAVIEAEVGRLANGLVALPDRQQEPALRVHRNLAGLLLVAFEGVEFDRARRAAIHRGVRYAADNVGRVELPVECGNQLADRGQRRRLGALGTKGGELTAILHSNVLVSAVGELPTLDRKSTRLN